MGLFKENKGGILPTELVSLVNRINEIEEKINNCDCFNKFKKNDLVNFIYASKLYTGVVLGKENASDCYCVRCGTISYMVPEKQIAYATNK